MTRRDRTGDLWNAQLDSADQIIDLWQRTSYDPTNRQNLDLNANYKHDFKQERGNLILDFNQSLGTENIKGYYTNLYYNPDSTASGLDPFQQRLFNIEKTTLLPHKPISLTYFQN